MFSPILIELTIVILFFALSTSVVVQLIAAAGATARESEYHARAILAMESVAEQIKADPAGSGACNECGVRASTKNVAEDLAVNCLVTDDPSPLQGTLYEIELSVTSPTGETYYLDAVRYIPDAEVLP
ncbi:hypothetical protein SDC9_138313 [bioreactor metagenome]|uniref:Uncharacterized protein n=1 Tax=bioreactor metagenome TaxID=1076179 RepID=A0A645DPF6_9ZZZZ